MKPTDSPPTSVVAATTRSTGEQEELQSIPRRPHPWNQGCRTPPPSNRSNDHIDGDYPLHRWRQRIASSLLNYCKKTSTCDENLLPGKTRSRYGKSSTGERKSSSLEATIVPFLFFSFFSLSYLCSFTFHNFFLSIYFTSLFFFFFIFIK